VTDPRVERYATLLVDTCVGVQPGWQVIVWGMPLERLRQTLWLLGALFVFCWVRPWRDQLRILLDWLPFVGFLVVWVVRVRDFV